MANTYTAAQLGIKAPAKGFENLGWYPSATGGSYQYLNGTFGESGAIHSASSQVGAGQAVSSEVNRQSDKAQGLAPGTIDAYLAKNKTVTPTTSTPTTGGLGATSMGSTGGGSGTGVGITAPQTLDLTGIYNNLYSQSGVSELETQLSNAEKSFNTAVSKINDNPFLSEASRVGRVQKLSTDYQNSVANLKNDVATKKADIETQLNLQTKQFDINSQAAKDALTQFNNLLSMGALTNASGEDIANLTRSTGLSSSIIQSAIQSSQKQDVNTQVIQNTDNNGNVTVSVINSDTGEVISQNSLGSVGGAKTTGGGSGTTSTTKNTEVQFQTDAESLQGSQTDQGWVGIFPQLVAKYAPIYSLDKIYSMYLNTVAGKQYGAPTESASEIKEVYDYYRGK